jgi:hypothetical protein
MLRSKSGKLEKVPSGADRQGRRSAHAPTRPPPSGMERSAKGDVPLRRAWSNLVALFLTRSLSVEVLCGLFGQRLSPGNAALFKLTRYPYPSLLSIDTFGSIMNYREKVAGRIDAGLSTSP